MQTLIVTFQLQGLDPATYAEQAAAIAPMFAELPGLLAKTWLADEATNTYGGVYFFADPAAVAAYLDSPIVRSLRTNSHYVNLTLRTFGTLDAPTRITRGEHSRSPIGKLAGIGGGAIPGDR
jgi:hypothetical protein